MNDKRKARYDKKIVAGVKPNTPNRKCIHQTIFKKTDVDGVEREMIKYYHVTKGWKIRRFHSQILGV